MDENIAYALIHSPLVGPFTWQLVYQGMRERRLQVNVATLLDDPDSNLPYWQQHAESAAASLAQIPKSQKLVLVAHSGAGPLLPVIRQALTHSIGAYVFVDAGIPRNSLSRLDLMKLEDGQWAKQLHQALMQGERFPMWNEDDLREIIPDGETRQKLIAEIRPRSLPYFTESIPVFYGWPDAPCAYIKFTASYDWDAIQARQAGWSVHEMNAGHFHMLVEPLTVADLIINTVRKLLDSPNSR